MSGPNASMSRALDAANKIAQLRAALSQAGAGAVWLRGADWFAWATSGADASAGDASPGDASRGAAGLLVTPDEACILADEAESERLRAEQAPDGFTYHVAPWAEPELHHTYALGAAGGRPVLSDRPQPGEAPLPAALRQRRLVLTPTEQERYRRLGRAAAEAMAEALRAARPDWTEWDLAGAGAHALWRRGIVPERVLAAGERRLALYRHPLPTSARLGRRALLAFGARQHGLVASLARTVAFDALTDDERTAQDELLHVEATGLDAVRPGAALSAVYHALAAAYRHANRPDAIRAHDQGGITGYAAREIVASPSTATGIEPGMAFALNPGFPGVQGTAAAALEDTFLLGPSGLENLTLDPHWPATTIQGRARPLWLEVP